MKAASRVKLAQDPVANVVLNLLGRASDIEDVGPWYVANGFDQHSVEVEPCLDAGVCDIDSISASNSLRNCR
jgi:hypothetical protein